LFAQYQVLTPLRVNAALTFCTTAPKAKAKIISKIIAFRKLCILKEPNLSMGNIST
jgi:hypothetical protein